MNELSITPGRVTLRLVGHAEPHTSWALSSNAVGIFLSDYEQPAERITFVPWVAIEAVAFDRETNR